MKLLRWAVGGASAYVIYKYSIGRKAKGEDVFVSPEKEIEKLSKPEEPVTAAPAAKPKRARRAPAKKPG
ncbi:hypothetical protein B2G71_10445 [Novosphingobium sp. PC22D]|uniref:hypothetical protein n=1 Tax=Novosphingobium sp. PC22D TaxID=1962403 RepID=UPI000BF0B786|nr:hypothetical protein [Novosphingobium sp. PC22D]PEQ12713.1 hypothetical protein B2G71_10445 [Novosphingobium sp. PC22D]